MRFLLLPSLLALGIIAASCSSTTGPVSVLPVDTTVTTHQPEDTILHAGPAIRRDYDTGRGGVQITKIYYDQNANRDSTDLNDEWIVLESDAPVNTTGWMLNAGDAGQNYPLRSTLNRKLVIYTHTGPAFAGDSVQALGLAASKWIWNNSEPDTAWIYDASGNVVDSMSYKR